VKPPRLRTGLIRLSLAVLAAAASPPASAQDLLPPAPYAYRQLDDPAQEARAQALMETLRCLKCQSQTIADSDAPMAGDMRSQVRQRIASGEDPEAIRAWLIERYGDYVSYKPVVKPVTWPLFAAPLLLLLLAFALLRRRFVRAAPVSGRARPSSQGAPILDEGARGGEPEATGSAMERREGPRGEGSTAPNDIGGSDDSVHGFASGMGRDDPQQAAAPSSLGDRGVCPIVHGSEDAR